MLASVAPIVAVCFCYCATKKKTLTFLFLPFSFHFVWVIPSKVAANKQKRPWNKGKHISYIFSLHFSHIVNAKSAPIINEWRTFLLLMKLIYELLSSLFVRVFIFGEKSLTQFLLLILFVIKNCYSVSCWFQFTMGPVFFITLQNK